MTPSVPRIALTPGEPAGVGPDLCIQLAQKPHAAELVAVADRDMLLERAEHLGLALELVDFRPDIPPQPLAAGQLGLLAVDAPAPVRCGQLDPVNASYVLETLRRATSLCLDRRCQAMVTGPVHKGVINDSGTTFTGHTEFLASLCHAQPVMMLATRGLRVALVTTHLPLSEVSKQITPGRLTRVLTTLHQNLVQRFGIPHPRLLVCGLNPHAGEGGYLGREELTVINPTLEQLRRDGLDLEGPLPADTLFTPPYLDRADVVVAMYHDQGLPVLKHMGFGSAVNVTLGLPIIRTSVDHGTALELAGSGSASASSLEAALALTLELCRKNPPC